jgi:hypothetical protein
VVSRVCRPDRVTYEGGPRRVASPTSVRSRRTRPETKPLRPPTTCSEMARCAELHR